MFIEKQQRPENRSIKCMQEHPLVFFTDLNLCTETQVLGSETFRMSSHFQQRKIVLFLSSNVKRRQIKMLAPIPSNLQLGT